MIPLREITMQPLCYHQGMLRSDRDATAGVPSATVTVVPALANLKELRTRAALSQRDLARLAGVAHTTVVRLEGGDPNVLPSTLRKLAKALHVKPAELIG